MGVECKCFGAFKVDGKVAFEGSDRNQSPTHVAKFELVSEEREARNSLPNRPVFSVHAVDYEIPTGPSLLRVAVGGHRRRFRFNESIVVGCWWSERNIELCVEGGIGIVGQQQVARHMGSAPRAANNAKTLSALFEHGVNLGVSQGPDQCAVLEIVDVELNLDRSVCDDDVLAFNFGRLSENLVEQGKTGE